MISYFEPIIRDIVRWSTAAIITSFFLSIISLILTVDLTLQNIPYLQLISTATSNFCFFIAVLFFTFALIPPFIRRPTTEHAAQSDFTPKYKNKKHKVPSPIKATEKANSNSSSFFIERDLKFLYSGLIILASSILIWISFLFIEVILL